MFTEMIKTLLRSRTDRRGASAIEYALIAAGAALAIGSMTTLRADLGSIFTAVKAAVTAGVPAATP